MVWLETIEGVEECKVASILLVHPCTSPSSLVIKRSYPRPPTAASFLTLFPTSDLRHRRVLPRSCVSPRLSNSGHAPAPRRTNTKQGGKRGPRRIHPSTPSRLNRGCQRRGTWVACLIKKTKRGKKREKSVHFVCSVPLSPHPRSTLSAVPFRRELRRDLRASAPRFRRIERRSSRWPTLHSAVPPDLLSVSGWTLDETRLKRPCGRFTRNYPPRARVPTFFQEN